MKPETAREHLLFHLGATLACASLIVSASMSQSDNKSIEDLMADLRKQQKVFDDALAKMESLVFKETET